MTGRAGDAISLFMQSLLDSRQLLAFSTLARVGSFTLAARELHLTQSAVSHAMKALEEDVGCRLFERAARRVSLTPAGEQLSRHVGRIMEEMTAARASLDTHSVWGQGRLRVGASTTACQYILPAVLREFKQSFPRCAISIEPGDHTRQLELIGGNQVDLAIMLAPSGRRELAFVPLFEDELHFVASSALAPGRRLARAALADQTLILYNKASFTFRLVSQYFREEGLPLGHFIELGSMDAIKELVKIGLGVGVLAPWVVRAELESGALVSFPLGRRQLSRHWGVVHRKDRRLSLGEETFIGLCRTVTENFGETTDD
jgi:DNA-binding transcriptional LysR family regulator